MSKKTNVVPLVPDWKCAFQAHAMKSSFCLSLSQPMLEFLCATADAVSWDRTLYSAQLGVARPNCWLVASHALEKRGLIERNHAPLPRDPECNLGWYTNWRLTPAGEALVALLKVTGVFVEADAAISRRLRDA